MIDGWAVTGLRCYEDSVLGFHDFGIAPSCNYTNVSVEELDNSRKIKMYPNPVNSILHLELNSNANFQIIDIGGREMLNGKLETDNAIINLEFLKSGIYLLRLKQNGILQSYKIQKL